jgi:hypothetical protein
MTHSEPIFKFSKGIVLCPSSSYHKISSSCFNKAFIPKTPYVCDTYIENLLGGRQWEGAEQGEWVLDESQMITQNLHLTG